MCETVTPVRPAGSNFEHKFLSPMLDPSLMGGSLGALIARPIALLIGSSNKRAHIACGRRL
jgi:hypothetical protein